MKRSSCASGQRIRPLVLDRVLRRDDEERQVERVRVAVDRDLRLLHRLEQRRLRLRRSAVDLVDEEHVREHRPRPELELARALVEDVDTGHVARQEVRRELEPREGEMQRARDGLREHRLPHSREVLDDQVAFGEHAEDAQLERRARCAHRALQVLDHALDDVGRRPRNDRPLRASGVRHTFESSRSTSSRTAAATTRFGAFATWRSPFSETTTTSFSSESKPMSGRETSL